jgi:arabinogalactan oligomer/maltooligosaccharide transport system substrate-binding protein
MLCTAGVYTGSPDGSLAWHSRAVLRAIGLALLLAACRDTPATSQIRFLHTFGPEETELFNKLIAERGLSVESSLVPFARGQQVIGEMLRAGASCPDLIRIDATWLSGLHGAKLLAPVPERLAQLDWTPEALAMVGAPARGVPQTVDGLVVVRDASRPAPATPAIDDLVTAARATRTPSSPYPLGVRSDGYWFVPWLRAEGIDLAPASIEGDGAVRALAKFTALFGDVAPPPPPAGSEAPDELRRWSSHDVAYWITGPWQLGVLEVRDRLVISPLAKAPRGGQVLVVPACARDPEGGWRLAEALTDVAMQQQLASELAMVPTRKSALASTTPLVQSIYEALKSAEPLPQAAHTPLLFDDLNPALAAVIAHDATPEEAAEGIRRGWKRIARGAP